MICNKNYVELRNCRRHFVTNTYLKRFFSIFKSGVINYRYVWKNNCFRGRVPADAACDNRLDNKNKHFERSTRSSSY